MFINLSKRVIIISMSIFAILIAVVGTAVYVFYKKGKLLDNKNSIQNISSYYAQYDMTVISNKNINTYFVKEWYVKNLGSKFEYLDYMKNKVCIIVKDDKCYIKNSGNKAYLLTKNLHNNKNISSLSFFIDMYNNNCNCIKNTITKSEKVVYNIKISNKDNCYMSNVLQDLSVTTFELTTKSSLPFTYIIYNKEKEYISILYRSIELNKKIDINEFNIT